MCAPAWALQPEGCNYLLALSDFIMLLHMPSYGKGHCSSHKLGWNNHSFLTNTSPDLKLCSETKESSLSIAVGGDAAHSALSLLRQVSIPVGKGRKYFYFGCCAVHQGLGMCCCCGDTGWSVPCAADLTAQSTGGTGSESCAQLSTTSTSPQNCTGK